MWPFLNYTQLTFRTQIFGSYLLYLSQPAFFYSQFLFASNPAWSQALSVWEGKLEGYSLRFNLGKLWQLRSVSILLAGFCSARNSPGWLQKVLPGFLISFMVLWLSSVTDACFVARDAFYSLDSLWPKQTQSEDGRASSKPRTQHILLFTTAFITAIAIPTETLEDHLCALPPLYCRCHKSIREWWWGVDTSDPFPGVASGWESSG